MGSPYVTIPHVPVIEEVVGERLFSGSERGGTDYPFPWMKTAVDHIPATPGLSDAERVALLGGTAAALLGISA